MAIMKTARDPPAQPIDPPDDNGDRDRRIFFDLIHQFHADTKIVIENLQAQVWRLTAEKVERDTPQWLPIKRAAPVAGCSYEWARSWAAKAIAAGRSHQATKTAGFGISINSTALTAAYRVRR
jgi:hypothetical protein